MTLVTSKVKRKLPRERQKCSSQIKASGRWGAQGPLSSHVALHFVSVPHRLQVVPDESHTRQVNRRHQRSSTRSEQHRERFCFSFFQCLEIAASWQHCMDYNTTSARVSQLGATTCGPGVWKTDSSLYMQGKKGTARAKSLQHVPPSGSPRTAKHLSSPGTRDPLKSDSSELSSQALRLRRNVQKACHTNIFAPQPPGKRIKTLCSPPSSEEKKVVLILRRHHVQHALFTHDAKAKEQKRATRL